ncbi:MAG TPA: DNA-3-methyladenine glycosylase 2 family protein [Stellaceae bacterium]|nr:DNA-3-methyladenine glycosylase 2 family protein [Stellaceae bacterium]
MSDLPDFDHAVTRLTRIDPDFAGIIKLAGPPLFVARPQGFRTLLHIILGQQISVAAAASMEAKLDARCRPLTAGRFLKLSDADLKECGFSRQKMAYARHLAEAITARRFDPKTLRAQADEAVLAELIKLKGIGRWSAEIYLLFALERSDIWPADDLALQLGVQYLKGLDARPSAANLRAIAEPWRPWRTAAACLIWHFYRHRLTLSRAASAPPKPVPDRSRSGR